MSILSIIDWGTKRLDQVFKWHGKRGRREKQKTVDVAVDRRDVPTIKRLLKDIRKARKTRRDSS